MSLASSGRGVLSGLKDLVVRRRAPDEVVLHSYPKLVFSWLLILLGFVLFPVSKWEWIDAETLGWIYGVVLVVTLMTIGIDVNRNAMFFWIAVVAAAWFLGLWLRDVKGVTFFGNFYRFLADLDPAYSRGFGLLVSLALSVPFVLMLGWTRVNDKWRITRNEFEHYEFGKADDSLARGAKRVLSRYPDLFEFVLGFAGELVVYDATGQRELRRIPHVLFLPSAMKRINRILEKTAVEAHLAEEEEAAAGETAGAEEERPA
jgi:hypothetical protein